MVYFRHIIGRLPGAHKNTPRMLGPGGKGEGEKGRSMSPASPRGSLHHPATTALHALVSTVAAVADHGDDAQDENHGDEAQD